MGFDPATMGAMKLVQGVFGAVGALEQGEASAAASNYNATLAGFNSQQAQRNAGIVSEAGSVNAAMKSQETRANVGAEKARAGGSGVGVNSGSNVDVPVSTSELGHMDALRIRTNAAKEAYGYEVQSTNFHNEGELDKFSAKQAKTASYINAASSLVGGASDAAGKYQQYKMNTGLGGVYGEGGSSHPNTDYGIDE